MPLVDHAAVRAQMGKILSSAAFVNSPRMSRFLRFVVESTLTGEGSTIKEYVIAIEVFDKPATYDPQADSTVRSEAGKLRSRLARYYADDGRNDPIVISIPKGSYVPAFQIRQNERAASAPSRAPWLRLAIVNTVVLAIVAAAIISMSRPALQPPPKLTPLTWYPGLEEQPSLSPDGSRVAFRWKGDIYVKQVGGEEIVPVTKDQVSASWPAWSPDGSRIAFVRDGRVFLVSPVGGVARRVAESAGRVAWTPDGAGLLVLENTSPYARSIFLIKLASSEKRRLTFPDDMSSGDTDVTISPDGRTIAFCRHLRTEGCDLFVAPVTGGDPRRLTNDQRFILGLAWTPDGRGIVFASDRQGSFRLWHVPARPPERHGAFEAPRLLEAAGEDARYPSISSTTKMAYERHARNFDIRRAEILGREGSATHRLRPSTLMIASTRLDVTPAWSPDGNKIAFVQTAPEIARCGSPTPMVPTRSC